MACLLIREFSFRILLNLDPNELSYSRTQEHLKIRGECLEHSEISYESKYL